MSSDSKIARLSHRVFLEEPVRTEDEGGTAIITWSTLAEVWAEITPRGRREIMKDDGFKGFMTHEVRLRYRAGVDQTMRFRFGTRLLEIRTVYDEGARQEWLFCQCEERRK
jgi:SPP1 family predicted phage head-tail adaptor